MVKYHDARFIYEICVNSPCTLLDNSSTDVIEFRTLLLPICTFQSEPHALDGWGNNMLKLKAQEMHSLQLQIRKKRPTRPAFQMRRRALVQALPDEGLAEQQLYVLFGP